MNAFKLVWALVIIIIIAGFVIVTDSMAMDDNVYTAGWNHDIVSIRDCSNRNHFQYHNEDPFACSTGQDGSMESNSDNGSDKDGSIVPVVPTVPTVPTVPNTPDVPNVPNVPNVPTVPTTPDVDDKNKSNNGNHYGNDKPDNNAKDSSKFNGDNTRDEFEQTKEETKDNKSGLGLDGVFVIYLLFGRGTKARRESMENVYAFDILPKGMNHTAIVYIKRHDGTTESYFTKKEVHLESVSTQYVSFPDNTNDEVIEKYFNS